jgi:hypothetical protein
MQGIGMWRAWQNGFDWDQFGSSILTGAYGGVANYAAMRAANKSCFAAGTPLRTPWGSVKIEDVRVGDLVLSRDEHNPDGVVVAQEVEEVFVREGLLTHVHAAGQVIRTTPEHPFYVARKGWTPCNQLKIGDLLLCEDGTWVPVDDLFETGEYETVYNVRVKDYHTYFVGCDEWAFSVWSHNRYDVDANGTPLKDEALNNTRRDYVEAMLRERGDFTPEQAKELADLGAEYGVNGLSLYEAVGTPTMGARLYRAGATPETRQAFFDEFSTQFRRDLALDAIRTAERNAAVAALGQELTDAIRHSVIRQRDNTRGVHDGPVSGEEAQLRSETSVAQRVLADMVAEAGIPIDSSLGNGLPRLPETLPPGVTLPPHVVELYNQILANRERITFLRKNILVGPPPAAPGPGGAPPSHGPGPLGAWELD